MADSGKVQIKPQDLQEISFIGDDRITSRYNMGVGQAFNPDSLVGRKGLNIYDKMLTDNQIVAVQNMKKMAILQSGWDVIPASEDSADEEIAEKVKWDFQKMKGTLTDRLWGMLSAKDYGFSITEQIYWIINEGDYEGLIGLKDLKTRRPHSFSFNVDDHGNLISLSQDAIFGPSSNDKLPPEKFVIFVNNKKFSNWFGESDLRPIYINWWSKYNHIKWWNMYGCRNGIPLAVGKYPQGLSEPMQKKLQDILNAVQDQMSILLPEECDIEFIEASKGGQVYFQVTVNFHDMAMAKGLLMPQLLGVSTQGDTGSYSQAKTQFNMFVLMIEMARKQVEEEIMDEQIIKPLINFNYVVSEYPQFKFNPLTSDDKFEIAKTWISIVTGGLTVQDLKDENRLRELLGFEKRDELIEVKEKPSEQKDELPDNEIPEEDIKEQSFKSYRLPDKIESKVDFARIEKDQDKLINKFSSQLIELFKKQKADLIDLLGRKIDKGILNAKFINNSIRLKQIGKIQSVFREFIQSGYNLGRADMNREAGKTQFAIDPVLPKDALKFLEEKRFWITGVLNDDILNEVRGVMLEGIRSGISRKEMEMKVSDIYNPFIGDPTAIKGAATVSPFRIETVLRTNLSEVYNVGRVNQALAPELADFVVGMEYSEILDDRTVPISLYVDGKKIRMDDPDFQEFSYPLHYNDRGLFVPVTQDDLPVEWLTAANKSKMRSLMGKFKKGGSKTKAPFPSVFERETEDEQDINNLVKSVSKLKNRDDLMREIFSSATDDEKRAIVGLSSNWKASSSSPVSTLMKEIFNDIHGTRTLFNGKYLDQDIELLKLNSEKVKQGLQSLGVNKETVREAVKKMEGISRAQFVNTFGDEKIKVYRGVTDDFFDKQVSWSPKIGSENDLLTDSLSSWTTKKDVARTFAEKGKIDGYVLEATIDKNDVALFFEGDEGEVTIKQKIRKVIAIEKRKGTGKF